MNIKKEEGENRKFSTGAEKQHSKGKGKPSLFPGDAYIEVCKHFEDGAEHYEARNWEKGIPLSDIIDSLERHIADEKMGDTSERHDRAMAWNAIVYLATKIRIQRGLLPKELADMPGYERQLKEVPLEIAQTAKACLDMFESEPTIALVPERGWRILLANGIFLMAYTTDGRALKWNGQSPQRNFRESSIPYYYNSKSDAVHCLNCYLEILKCDSM